MANDVLIINGDNGMLIVPMKKVIYSKYDSVSNILTIIMIDNHTETVTLKEGQSIDEYVEFFKN